MHVDFFLEEQSAEAFIESFVDRILRPGTTTNSIVFQGKTDLLANLQNRLRAYRHWIPEDYRIVVLVDRDDEDCQQLKQRLERIAIDAGLTTKSNPREGHFKVLNRIACEELEAWFFGDVTAVVQAFPGVPTTLGDRAPYRDADAITGGTWEALERVLQAAGYYPGGLPKIEVARMIGERLDPDRNRSSSFRTFVEGVRAL